MQNTVEAGFIYITFEDSDFKKDIAMKVMADFKQRGHITKFENGFDYDPDTKTWVFSDNEINRNYLEKIKQKYFFDPNQENLF